MLADVCVDDFLACLAAADTDSLPRTAARVGATCRILAAVSAQTLPAQSSQAGSHWVSSSSKQVWGSHIKGWEVVMQARIVRTPTQAAVLLDLTICV